MNHVDIEIEKIVRSRRKTYALEVTEKGTLIVRVPLHARDTAIRRVIEKHREWIRRQKRRVDTRNAENLPKEFIEGEPFLYLGVSYRLKLVEEQTPPLRLEDDFILMKSPLPYTRRIFEDWYRERAREVIGKRVLELARRHGFRYNRVRITGARKRWGSCSPKGNLNFTWRLVMAPLPVIDYVVIHELVHLVEKNHSKRFWNKVGTLMPDYRSHKIWLRKNGHLLKI
jgi:predicted metal-dependent hydrolase